MDTSRSEGSLLDEIHFLTNLINSHQCTRGSGPLLRDRLGSSRHEYRTSRPPPREPHPSVPKSRLKTKNMVYRPPRRVSQQADSRPTGRAPPRENNHFRSTGQPCSGASNGSDKQEKTTKSSHSTSQPVNPSLPASHGPSKRSNQPSMKSGLIPGHTTSQSIHKTEDFKLSVEFKTEPLSPSPFFSSGAGGSHSLRSLERSSNHNDLSSSVNRDAAPWSAGLTLAAATGEARRTVIGRRTKAKMYTNPERKVVMDPVINGPGTTSSSANRVVLAMATPALPPPPNQPPAPNQQAVSQKKRTTPTNQPPQGQATLNNQLPVQASKKPRNRRYRRRYKWKPNGATHTPAFKATPQLTTSNVYKYLGSPMKTSTPGDVSTFQATRKRKRGRGGKWGARGANFKKNRVWVRPSPQTAENTWSLPVPPPPPQIDDNRYYPALMETDVVFISPETISQPIPAKPVEAADLVSRDRPDKPAEPVRLQGHKPAEPVRLQGHEWKTRQGNKQWVVAGASAGQAKAVSLNRPVEPVHQDRIINQDRPVKSLAKPVESPDKPVNQDRPVNPQDVPTDQHKPIDSVTESWPIEPVRLFGHEKKTRQGNKQWVTAGAHASQQRPVEPVGRDSHAQPIQLIGHEKKTRQGNKQWVVARKPVRQGNLVRPVRMVGHEKKTKRGNKQWVVAGLTPRRRISRRNSRTKHRPSLVSFNGGRYTMDHTGRRLKRLSTSSSSQLACLSPAITGYLGGIISSSAKRIKASRVVKRSKAFVWHARMKKQKEKSEQFCLFFNRFGKCNKGKDCPYIHDPDKIAVCTKFLRGTCDRVDGTCPFSHKISKEKMPVCSYFLRGVCSREDCPYLHVSVGRDAKVCPDFLKGYCSRGEKCTMQHTLDCPKFFLTGSCPEGSKCPLRHTRKLPALTLVKEPRAFKKIRYKRELLTCHIQGGDGEGGPESGEGGGEGGGEDQQRPATTSSELDFMPLELGAAPDFIPL